MPDQPPAANPTTTSSPPTPGPRATRLHQVYTQALARTLRANSYANFSGCFPTPARHVPASLESVWRQLNAKLEESARAEFEDVVVERGATGLLNRLDFLVGEARERMMSESGEEGKDGERGKDKGEGEREIVAPHTLPPEELYKAHLTPHLREMQSMLDTRIQDTHDQNAELAQTVQDQRAEIQNLLQGLEGVVSDLDGAAIAADKFTRENELRRENVKMDEEVRARPVI